MVTFYRRRLPHWHPEGAVLFLTWRLADGAGRWLEDPRVAGMVAEKIHYGEQQRHFYCLDAWVVMPNHVHLLLEPWRAVPVILRWLKGSTAREANRILGRTGRSFWQDESFDHWVRDEGERQKFLRYIEWNPVTAGLAKSVEEWPWSSAAGAFTISRGGSSRGRCCPT
jgi:REP element-mobilizing transposase RayT